MILTGTFMTDEVGRDFMKFTVGALVKAHWDDVGRGTPSFLSHDMTRPIGWLSTQSVYFEPGLSRVVGESLLAETEEDKTSLLKLLNRRFWEQLEADQAAELTELRTLIAPHLAGDEMPRCRDAASLVGRGLATRCFPDLFSPDVLDDDGLIELNRLQVVDPGVYRVGELLVFAHAFLRRSYVQLNSLNSPFLGAFHNLDNESVTRKIKLDPDLVGLARTFRGGIIERSYWWGPSFNDTIPEIGAGVYHRESTEREKVFHPVSATECFWYHRGEHHNFEAEELRDIPTVVDDTEKFVCRYAHAMMPQGENDPCHFDGAVRIYTEEEMLIRLDTDLMRAGRNTEYVKLWRVDGDLPNADWKRLLSDYYRDNTHVGEYLGGTPGEAIIRENEESKPQHVSLRLVPHSLSPEDGLRIAVSARQGRRTGVEGVSLLASYGMVLEGVETAILDLEAMDFVKAMSRLGHQVKMPEAFVFEVCYDAYSTIPVVMHEGQDAVSSARVSLQAIRELVANRLTRQTDFVMAFSLRYPIDQKDIIISVVGHGQALDQWLSSDSASIPDSLDALVEWCERVAAELSNKAAKTDGPNYDDFLGMNGEFTIQRVRLPDGAYEIKPDEKGVRCILKLPQEGQSALLEEIDTGRYAFGLGTGCSDPICRSCDKPYRACQCCRWLDLPFGIECPPDLGHFAFWTDRPV